MGDADLLGMFDPLKANAAPAAVGAPAAAVAQRPPDLARSDAAGERAALVDLVGALGG